METCIESFTLLGINFCIKNGFQPSLDKGESYFSWHDSFHARIDAPPTVDGELMVHHYQDGLVGNEFTPNPIGNLYIGHTLCIEQQYQHWCQGKLDSEFYYSSNLLTKIREYVK